ncbi:MAG: hypothetical protein R2748_16365 [Bryobacterales bacterium]
MKALDVMALRAIVLIGLTLEFALVYIFMTGLAVGGTDLEHCLWAGGLVAGFALDRGVLARQGVLGARVHLAVKGRWNEAVDDMASAALPGVGAGRELLAVRVVFAMAVKALRMRDWLAKFRAGVARLARQAVVLALEREVGLGVIEAPRKLAGQPVRGGVTARATVRESALVRVLVAGLALRRTKAVELDETIRFLVACGALDCAVPAGQGEVGLLVVKLRDVFDGRGDVAALTIRTDLPAMGIVVALRALGWQTEVGALRILHLRLAKDIEIHAV